MQECNTILQCTARKSALQYCSALQSNNSEVARVCCFALQCSPLLHYNILVHVWGGGSELARLGDKKWRLLLAAGQDWLEGKPSFTDGVNYHDGAGDTDDDDDDDNNDDDDDDDEHQRPISTWLLEIRALYISWAIHYLAIGQQGGVVKEVWDQAD